MVHLKREKEMPVTKRKIKRRRKNPDLYISDFIGTEVIVVLIKDINTEFYITGILHYTDNKYSVSVDYSYVMFHEKYITSLKLTSSDKLKITII